MQEENTYTQGTWHPELWDNVRRFNVCYWDTRRSNRAGVFEIIMAKTFPELMTDTKPEIQRIEKYPKKRTWVYHIQTTEKQREIEQDKVRQEGGGRKQKTKTSPTEDEEYESQ